MGFRYKIVVLILLVIGLVSARTGKNNFRMEEKKVKSEHYWAKDNTEDNGNKIDRKRVHKRRRKIKKPVKGLR